MFSQRLVLHFPRRLVDKPVICRLAKDYGLEFNILKANVTPPEEGILVLEVNGGENNCRDGIAYLRGLGVRIQPLAADIARDETRCTDCGVCVPMCPSGALRMEAQTRQVCFDAGRCIACGHCGRVCPVKAMEVRF